MAVVLLLLSSLFLIPTSSTSFCDENHLAGLLTKIHVICPGGIIDLAMSSSSEGDLDRACRRVSTVVTSARVYLQDCTFEPSNQTNQSNLYLQLLLGVKCFFKKVCGDKQFQSKIQKAAVCLKHIRYEYRNCYGPADWIESLNQVETCWNYGNITECYYTKTGILCGRETALTVASLVTSVLDCAMAVQCKWSPSQQLVLFMPQSEIELRALSASSTRTFPGTCQSTVLLKILCTLSVYFQY